MEESITIKQLVQELLETSIFKTIEKRNGTLFAQELASWLVRYILVISSMNESLKLELEEILRDLHGDSFQKILELTENIFEILSLESVKKG
jgi:hypothetical protein